MRALAFDGSEARVGDWPEPQPGGGGAIVRMIAAGICNTDLEIVRGYLGFRGVLGHELVGRVERGPAEWLGRRVAVEINFACGACEWCRRGLGRHCPARTVMGIVGQDGAFAERVAVPVANLHEVPAAVGDEQAVFVEPLAAAFEIVEQTEVAGREALVLGDGKLGLLVAQVLHGAGARVLAVGKHDDHLALLAERGIRSARLDRWDRTPRDLVVEATGTAEGFALAVAATRPRGTLVLKSTVAKPAPVDLAPLVIHEIEVVGSRCGPFAPAIAALANGSVRVEGMISGCFDLEGGARALERAGARGALKVLIAG